MDELSALLRMEKGRLTEVRRALEKQLREVNERIRHVDGLLRPNSTTENDSNDVPTPGDPDICDIVVEILEERAGEPAHYKLLAAEVKARGGKISSANPASVLLTRLVRDDRFVRPERRGFYALKNDHPDAANVGARKQRAEKDESGKGERL